MTPKWQSPRRLPAKIAKTRPVTRDLAEKRRIALSKCSMHSARARGLKRGGAR